jgi:DNA transformation protein
MEPSVKLEDLPNIGASLAELHHEAEINTPEELYKNGTFQAFIRIKAIDPTACFSKLCAIEGAIESIRWHHLSKEKKSELKQFFTLFNK